MGHSLFVIGAGRNGTSMTAGLFQKAGLHMGGVLHPATPENPRGYFEGALVNGLNNRILGRYNPAREVIDGRGYRHDSPGTGNGWLSRIPLETEITATPEEQAEIVQAVSKGPFCLKDPRFCYLLHLWRAAAPKARMICVFRHPAIAVTSILNSLRLRPGLYDMALSVNQAFEIWTLMYRHVLERHATSGEWLFVDYDDVLSGRALPVMEHFSGHALDAGFPDAALNRTEAEFDTPAATAEVHAALQARARQDVRRGRGARVRSFLKW